VRTVDADQSLTRANLGYLGRSGPKAPGAFKENEMQEFPIWLKLIIWGTIGLTIGYTIWSMLISIAQS
jgi:hypothetical protein